MVKSDSTPVIVIVGGGFGGLWAAKALRKALARVMLIDRVNHHVFQPLLYQVASAGLSPADIAQPIRSILSNQDNVEVMLAEVIGVDAEASAIHVQIEEGVSRSIPYDFLILATGARHSYFGHDGWERHAPGLKTLDDATKMRARILLAFERAESATSDEEKDAFMTFVLVGGGPTGVELAGAIAEIAFRALARDFDHIDPRKAKVVLVEAGTRLLPSFPEELSTYTKNALEKLGVDVRLETSVTSVDDRGVETSKGRIAARTVLWAAGNQIGPIAKWLDAKSDRAGRVEVEADCTVPGYPNVFVIGDAMAMQGSDGKPLPGVAQVAMQQGTYAAKVISSRIASKTDPGPFRYRDKGILATIGKKLAVADVQGRHFRGFVAWFLWLTIHIWYLIGFRNKILVIVQWAWYYATFQRGARLITHVREAE